MNLDTRDVTHLRYLADHMVARPDSASEILSTLINTFARPDTDPLMRILRELEFQFAIRNNDINTNSLREIARIFVGLQE